MGRAQAYNQVFVHLVELNHRDGGERVEDDSGRGPGFEARRAGDDFRAGQGADDDIDLWLVVNGLDAGEEDGFSSAFGGAAEGAVDEGRGSAGGDAHHNVVRAD